MNVIQDEEGNLNKAPFKYISNEEFIFAIVDANDKFLFGIEWDGTQKFCKTSLIEEKLQSQINLLADKIATIIGDDDTTNIIDTMNELKKFFADIENTEALTNILVNLDNIANNLDKTTINDEEGNIQDTPFRVISNEEFIKAIVDSEDRVLFGFYRATGKPYYPLNEMYHVIQNEEFLWLILDKANHPLLGIQQDGTCWAAKAQWLDDIKAIKNALSSIDETLKTFQPKEDGKGLINLDVADSFFYISNDEYIIAVVDAENRILAGIKYDGEPYFPNNEMYYVITNEEWLYAIIDDEEKVLCGFRADDGHMIVGGIDINNVIVDVADIKERTAHLSTIENDEYLSIETDAEGKVIGYIAPDGIHYLYKVKSETIDAKVDKEEGKSLIDADVADAHSAIEDPEGRTEITSDADGKVFGYRDSEGTRHEHKISVTHINLSDDAVKEVNDAFKSAGIKTDNPSDFSNDSYIELPIPRIAAQVKLYAPKLPTTKTDDIEAEIEYIDKDGNYFKIKVILNAQGASSMRYKVKNMAFDTLDGRKIKFGDFPAQDSFHIKKYYIDAFRGQCIVGYWLTEQVYKSRPLGEQYPYEYLQNTITKDEGNGIVSKDFFNGAKCHPDGFPVVITWINSVTGEENYMGVYTWNLKKSKEVYNMNKSNPNNIVLDGIIGTDTLFGGSISWKDFEIRNPKSLKDIDGNKYDGDNPKELSDTDTKSKAVKDNLERFSAACAAIASDKTKENFEKYFLVNPFIDYVLLSQLLYNADGFRKNWIWCSWDGKRFTPTMYDLDSIFGQDTTGTSIIPNSTTLSLGDSIKPCNLLIELYNDVLIARYKYLRDNGIFSTENVVSLMEKWLDKVGYNNIKKDLDTYKDTPSYRDSCINEQWEFVNYTWNDSMSDYSEEKTYNEGETCVYKGYKFKAKSQVLGVAPVSKVYDSQPYLMGFHNSLLRVKLWMDDRIKTLDNKYNYNLK